jgi:hypothetical protein
VEGRYTSWGSGRSSRCWGVSFLLVLTPGADWAYAIGAGLWDRTVLPAVGGLVAGYVALTVVVADGVAALVARSAMVLTAVRAVGAAVPDLGGHLEHDGDGRRARPRPRAEAIEPVLDAIRPVAAERPLLAEVLAEIEEPCRSSVTLERRRI